MDSVYLAQELATCSNGQNIELRDLPPHPSISMHSNMITAGRDNIFNISTGLPQNPFADMRRLAQWLSSLNSHQIHKDVSEKVMKGTGSWIFEHPKFVDWLSNKINVLWGAGIPGAGKTCLTSIVIDHLTNQRQATVLYIYCQYKDSLSTLDLLAYLLKQMVEASSEAAKFVSKTLQDFCHCTDTRPSRSELLTTIRGALQIFTTEVFLVVDALDELKSEVRPELVGDLFSLEQPLFMTSRPLTDLPKRKEPDFIIHAPDEDIYAFLSSRIDDIPKLEPYLRESDVRAQIINRIHERCKGMFLLAALQIDALASGGITDSQSLQETVDQLPTTLYERYSLTFQRIQRQTPREYNLACRAIVLVTHAVEYFDVGELLEALTIDIESESADKARLTTEETLIRVCLGLLTIEKESRTVHLIHHTAQSFFETRHDLIFNNPHDFIANISAIYLSQPNLISDMQNTLSGLDVTLRSHPFFLYACRFVGYHSRVVGHSISGQVPIHVRTLFRKRLFVPMLLPLAFGDYIDHGQGIHFAAIHGLASFFDENLQTLDNVSALDCSSLFYACLGGHTTMVEQILASKHGPRLKIGCPTKFGATVLHAACQSGNPSVVRLLLPMTGPKSGFFSARTIQRSFGYQPIDINARMSYERTALHIASEEGYTSVVDALLGHAGTEGDTTAFVEGRSVQHQTPEPTGAYHSATLRSLLRATKIDINAQNSDGWAALHLAIEGGHDLVAWRLLNVPDIDVNITAHDRWTPLHISALRGRDTVAFMLLNSVGIDINFPALKERTALHLAAQNGHQEVARLLLERPNMDSNIRDHSGHTPLHLAAKNGHESVIQLLVAARGIDINAKNHLLDTPLHLAALNGHAGVVQILFSSADIDFEPRDDEQYTPLHLAAREGHDNVVRLLISSAHINVNARATNGLTPLHAAALTGQESVVRVLLTSHKVDMLAKSYDQYTPLQVAAEYGHEAVVRLLLPFTDLATIAQASQGWPPLHLAAQNGHEGVVRLLLEVPGVDVNGKAYQGRTALHQASQGGHDTIVKSLLNHHSIDVNLKDENNLTPLHLAVLVGHEGAIQLLLGSVNVDPNVKDGTGWTALHLAAIHGRDGVVTLLLRSPSTDVNVKGSEGLTPLHAAITAGHEATIRLLCTSPHIDVNAEAASGWTPLHLAACTGNETVVGLLLASASIRVNAQNDDGLTPLHYAVQADSVGAVRLLLNSPGINAHVVGTAPPLMGKTPLELASGQDNPHIAAVFEDMGLNQTGDAASEES